MVGSKIRASLSGKSNLEYTPCLLLVIGQSIVQAGVDATLDSVDVEMEKVAAKISKYTKLDEHDGNNQQNLLSYQASCLLFLEVSLIILGHDYQDCDFWIT